MTVRVVDTEEDARGMYRTFMDKPSLRKQKMEFGWPKRMQEVGTGRAVMYRSNKWKRNKDDWEDYKHIAESDQLVYVTPGFLREWSNPNKKLKVTGPMVTLQSPMPQHFATLAPLLGVQLNLFGYRGDEGMYEVTMSRAILGGARHPETEEPFLFVYTPTSGVHMLLTGEELAVEKDGIVG